MNQEKIEKTKQLVEEIIKGQASRVEKGKLEEYFSSIDRDKLFRQCYSEVEKTSLNAEKLKKIKDIESKEKCEKIIDKFKTEE
ncbi:MAG: hypothetical protein GX926_02845 [Candidatus Magasanikbacteria bacterium]|nr:hypothetical protein [Candidatus Magasanikbacteria bacterium]